MANEIQVRNAAEIARPRTSRDMLQQAAIISDVLKQVMQSGTHYMILPGGKEPTLLKPGAEKILATFRIVCDPEVEDLSTADCVRYRVRARGTAPDGTLIGVGVGECSSDEEKYRWRRAVCDEEFDEAATERKRIKYHKRGGAVKQVRTEPADIANTVLKMAKKRAQVELCLTSTAASDCFTQDLDDMPQEIRDSLVEADAHTPPTIQQPRRQSHKTTGSSSGNVDDIKSATAKNGTIVFGVVVNDGVTYRTCSDELAEVARFAKQSGSPVDIEYERRGKSYWLTALREAAFESESSDA